ncbi:MAG: P22 phage major capsid protein family protein, partial [Thermoguttaceae bacterium]
FGSGTANTSYPMSFAYHQDAFTLATADLELPQGVDFAARETYDGISMRIVRAFDITNDQFPCRIDVLGGWATLRPELACRITG